MFTSITRGVSLKKILYSLTIITFVILANSFYQSVFAFTPDSSVPDTTPVYGANGSVDEIIVDGNILYVGGNFSYAGKPSPYIALVEKTSGETTMEFPYVNSAIKTAISDNVGGWYIGGEFTQVGGEAINHVAHILADGTLDSDFDLNINNNVFALALDGNTLYVGGSFNEVNGGTTRNRLAAFDTDTGIATAFNPNLNATVDALLLDGTTLYVGGGFNDVNGGTARSGLAAFNTTTGIATAFDPDLDGSTP